MIKWVSLKIILLPSIIEEVDNLTEEYLKTLSQIDLNSDSKEIKNLLVFRESIEKRIEEIEKFYEDNIRDPRVSYFEKVRVKLKKLLTYDIEFLQNLNQDEGKNEKEETYNTRNIRNIVNTTTNFQTSQNFFTNQGNQFSSPTKKPLVKVNSMNSEMKNPKTSNNQSAKKSSEQDKYQDKYSSPQKVIDWRERQNTFSQKLKTKEKEVVVFKIGDLNLKNQNEKMKMSKEELFYKMMTLGNFKEINKYKEIIFRVKLSESEYRILLKEKSNLSNKN